MAGFKYVRSQAGGGTTGNVYTFAVDATHASRLGVGDVVVITGDADANGVQEVDAGNATTANTGVIESIDFGLAGETLTDATGLAASTAGTVKVRVDQYALYEVDSDATATAAQVGLNVGINTTAATQSGGLTVSNMNVDIATAATTITLPFRIVALLEDEAGTLGAKVLVRPNATTASDGAVGIS